MEIYLAVVWFPPDWIALASEIRPKMAQDCLYKFGVFEFNPAAHELRKHGVRIRLSGQPFALLAILLEVPGQIVTRDEMRLRLWRGDTIVDFEHSLNSAIKKLRAALGDSPENSRYVETIPKVGYRFVAPVEIVARGSVTSTSTAQPESQLATSLDGHDQDVRWRIPSWIWFSAAGALALASFAIFRTVSHSGKPPSAPGRVMIAVLPFENLTGDSTQDYFSDGLTEEMIEQLGRVDPQHLGVIARSSTARFQRDGASLEKIQRELRVQYVVEGTVRRDSDHVRVTAELIQLKDQSHVWSREYDRGLDQLLELQVEIAQQLAHELSLAVSPNRERRNAAALSPEAYQAYDLYLKGRFFWNKRTKQGFERALDCFQQATAKDPQYARAYAAIADTYALIAGYYLAPIKQVSPKAKAAAMRALELDESLSETHTALALIAQNIDWDWATAEKEYKRAIELDPNYATAHHWYAEELSLVGRFDEALAEIEIARQLDPLSLIIGTDRGAILYYSRQYDRAIEQFQVVLDMEPNYPRARMIENAYAQKGMLREALADADIWQRTNENAWSVSMRAYLLGLAGNRNQALATASYLKTKYADTLGFPALVAYTYVGLNDTDAALSWFERAYNDRSIPTSIAVEPSFDPLRNEPRFQAILKKMHFAPNVGAAPTAAHK